MSGSADGLVPVHHRLPVEIVSRRSARSRAGLVEALAREPFVLLVLAFYALILGLRPWLHVRSDTWLALVGGRLVSREGMPHHDTLTVWAQGREWVDQQWLGQLLFYWLHAAGGLGLLLFSHVLLLVLAFALALAFARHTGASSRSVALVGLVAMFVALPNSVARTQSFAYVLFVAVFCLLAADSRMPSRRVLLVLPLLVLWANVHGSAVLGAGLVALWAAASLIRVGRRHGADARRSRLRATAVAAGAFLCLLVTPYGLGVVGYYRDILGSGVLRDLVTEWGPTTFSEAPLFFALAVATVWLVARRPRTLSLFEHLALIALLFAGLGALRNVVWFAFAATMVAPRALDAVWPVAESPLRRRVNVGLSLVALALLALSLVSAGARARASDAYPERAAAAVASAADRDPSLRVFANEAFADWLLWRVPALKGRVAFDARFELLSDPELRAIARFRHRETPGWRVAARGYRLLVLDPSSEQGAIRSIRREPGTRALFRNDRIVVLLRSRA
jgi:hypothetical protein